MWDLWSISGTGMGFFLVLRFHPSVLFHQILHFPHLSSEAVTMGHHNLRTKELSHPILIVLVFFFSFREVG
jgi:uncharacterized membrane protein